MRPSEAQSSSKSSKSNPTAESTAAAAAAVDAGQRWHMIAEAAYFLAEHRGFDGGDPLQDWLAAEAEIERLIAAGHAREPVEAAAYARLREEVGKAFSQVQEAVDAAALKAAFERGLAEARRLEGQSAEVMHKVAATLREDLARSSERMGPAWEHFSERSAGLFSVWKDRSRAFRDRTAAAVREWLHHEARGQKH